MDSDGSVLEELVLGATRFFNLLVPPIGDRRRITWKNFPYTLAYLGPVLFMAYLARRPNTHLIRLLMLPSTIAVTLHSCFGYEWVGRGFHVYNWGAALVGLLVIGKAIDFATVPEGHFKVGERNHGEDSEPAISKKDHDPTDPSHSYTNGNASPNSVPVTGKNRPGSSVVLPLWLKDALELSWSLRGIGWEWGKGVYIPVERKPLSRHPFLLATLSSFLWSFLALDFLESCLKLVPGVGLSTGGTIFLSQFPPILRYAFSTAIHFATGFSLLAGFIMCYALATLVGVGLLRHHPMSWPPVVDRPWAATSLHEFWAKRWHQLLRQTFLVYGGRPLYKLLGGQGGGEKAQIGMVLGAFITSGMYHKLSSTSMGRGVDYRVILFFVLQGALVILERVWKIVTGRRVGGWPSTMWVYFVIGVLGQPLVDAWHNKGLAGGAVIGIPSPISPTRKLLFPILSKLTGLEFDLYAL